MARLRILVVLAFVPGMALAQMPDADPATVEAGRYLATAGDCAACHGESFAGGDPIASPMGDIYATNITPDVATGIGGWSLAQFSDVLRRGEAPDGHIFPAMPYTAYTGLDDDQIAALYSYLMLGVEPVGNVVPETDLPFPFKRAAMIGWNALFLDEGTSIGAIDVSGALVERGRVLVESLGHCSACHTPRGQLMQPIADRHLGGAMIDGWWAPNITPGPGGIGEWSDALLTQYLTTGHTGAAIAAGEMSKVVALSLSRLEPADIDAIVAYLRAVPSVPSTEIVPRVASTGGIEVAELEAGPARGAASVDEWTVLMDHDTTDGGLLYQSACASCHGIDGNGSAGLALPSLRQVEGVATPKGATLVQVIAQGVNRRVGAYHALMPGFRADMDDAQIAAVANHVRATFGGVAGDVDAGRVSAILDGNIGTPWLIANARWLSYAGIAAAVGLLLLLGGWIALRGRRHRGRLA